MSKKKIIIGIFFIFLISAIFLASSVKECKDDDKDGVCNEYDKCPGSLPREVIDENGCDAFQFCRQFYCGMSCFYADFLNNEPDKKYPHDCTVVLIVKEGSYKPKCVPLDCRKSLNIPNSTITIRVKEGNESYVDVLLMDVPAGYDISNGYYIGWCVDQNNTIVVYKNYTAKLYSSYDPDLAIKCPHCVDEDWPKVNFIINNKKGTKEDVQAAIWYFIDSGVYPSDADAIAMVEEAKIYGSDFYPREGQFMAIIVDMGSRIQLIIIEVDP